MEPQDWAQLCRKEAAGTRDPVTKLPPEFVMIGRVFGTLAGLFQHYRPAIDFSRWVLPHLFIRA